MRLDALHRRLTSFVAHCPIAWWLGVATSWGLAAESVDYARDIQPLLSQRCYACHGPDEQAREAGLRLDRLEGLHQPLASGKTAVVAGQAAASELLQRITADDAELRMPPPEAGNPLSVAEIEVLTRWVAGGAQTSGHWSFQTMQAIELPSVERVGWVRQPIDNFVLAKLEELGLSPSPEADAATLLRRVYLDLTGLPPAPEEVMAFLGDREEDAYERLVDRLLASPHFGERWGRHWLDIAHYADSDGYLGDALRPHAWRYRDWVVQAINRDLSFDQFTAEQLAGDLLPGSTLEQQLATGFLRNTLRNTEAGVDLEEYRLKEMVDRVSTVGVGWLGLSLGCAECHSHKYDPVSQQEFYQLLAFFNRAEDIDLPFPAAEEKAEYAKELADWKRNDDRLRRRLIERAAQVEPALTWFDPVAWLRASAVDAKKRSQEDKKIVEQARMQLPADMLRLCRDYEQHWGRQPKSPNPKFMAVSAQAEPRETYVHLRGDYRNRGPLVAPEVPAFLGPLESRGELPDRLDLARWLVDERQPLTARVVVNQIWAHLFGRGLVASVDNFGVTGEFPSHPELLDWLAREFVRRHWSRKDLIRCLVTSATYRQSAATRQELQERDPRNRWLARQSRFRVEAEVVRDLALAVAGLLDRRQGGPPIRPPQPAYIASISRNTEWIPSEGGDLHRRGLYILLRRATLYPTLVTFDAPDTTLVCTQRTRTNSPLQALTLLNDPVFFSCAQSLGKSLAMREELTDSERLVEVYVRCLARRPTAAEFDRLQQTLIGLRHELMADPLAAGEILGDADGFGPRPPMDGNGAIEAAAFVLLTRILLNTDTFITRE
jgi:hypothetical protein